MNVRRFLAEAATIAGLAIVCALVSNALARKERRLELPGRYPNATKVADAASRAPLAPFAAAAPQPVETPAPAAGVSAPATKPADRPRTSVAPAPAASPAALSSPSSVAGPAAAGPGRFEEVQRRFPPHGQPFAEIPGDAAAWLHARGVLFLDARRSKDFAESHVAGARSFPVWEPEVVKEEVEAFLAEGHDHAAPLVAYCTGGDCEDSHMLANMLFGAGFENVLVYRDGFPDWLARGGALAAGRGR